MYLTGVVDVGNAAARGVAAPSLEHALQFGVVMGQARGHPLQQQHRIGVVVTADEVRVATVQDVAPGPLEDQAHGLAAPLLPGVELATDRKSVVKGTGGSVRFDLGWCRILK